MKVTLIDFTGAGHKDPADYAASLLIFTKNTRLTMSPEFRDHIEHHWPADKKYAELQYMANTIPSSWEFIDYTFMIEGVTRAFTHQLVRTRQASYAQQTMRVLDVSSGPGWDYLTGPTIDERDGKTGERDLTIKDIYDGAMTVIADSYEELINAGAAIEDARGILPTNILTNIVMKCNMRTFVELVRKRSSSRTQGEYRDVLEAMKEQVRAVHPWINLFIDRTFDKAANELDEKVRGLEIEPAAKTAMIKLIDQMRVG